ncbi:putative vacuolar protein sorting-associated protein Ist1 [Helianthus anomalus]
MKNKKVVHINQMGSWLSCLRLARNVPLEFEEYKMVATYDLIEISCEFIVGRLPIIKSQKTCAIHLKEAVTSVICAAPRCSDISELYDV